MNLKKFWWLYLVLSLSLFIYNGIKKFQSDDITYWRTQSCHWKNLRTFQHPDCGMPLRQATLWASPYFNYQETIQCHPHSQSTFPQGECLNQDPTLWRGPRFIPEIGWDAYSTWYLRASLLYFESQKKEWPGLLKALTDTTFLSSLPAKEHYKYPWGLSLLYYKILKIFDNAHPLPLQVLQVLVFFAASFFLFQLSPRLPLPLRLSFIFMPIGAHFVFKLYADIWILFWNALLIWALSRNRALLAFIAAFLSLHFKGEALVHVVLILGTFLCFHLVAKNNKLKLKTLASALVGLILSKGLLVYLSHANPPETFWAPLPTRLLDLESYTVRLPQIMRYYLDVFFRPSLWFLFWPLSLVIFIRTQNKEKLLYLPLVILWALIPIAFLGCPDGSYREVVLTGSNRALWQCVPLAIFLMNYFKNYLSFSKTKSAD